MPDYQVQLEFITPILGTVPLNRQLYVDYIASRDGAPPAAAAEADTIVESPDKGKTGFHRTADGTPALYDYHILGFLKDAAGMLSRVADSESKKIRAYKKVIDGLVFVEPRLIPFQAAGEVGELQRPLRAQTPQGERVALAFSETLPEGAKLEFTLTVLDDKQVPEAWLREMFCYGRLRGLGQWRNGSWGRFLHVLELKS